MLGLLGLVRVSLAAVRRDVMGRGRRGLEDLQVYSLARQV